MQDGTFLPLPIKPECEDADDYHSQEFMYSITVNIINDDQRQIQAYCADYPGRTKDNRAWRNINTKNQIHIFL